MIFIDVETARLLAAIPADALAPLLLRADVTVSPAVATVLAGRSIPAIRAAVDAGELAAEGATHRRISLANLAAWSGRAPYYADELAGAFRRLSQLAVAPPAITDGDDGGRRNT